MFKHCGRANSSGWPEETDCPPQPFQNIVARTMNVTTSLAFMFTPAGGYPALIHLARPGKDRLGGFLNKAAFAAAPRTRFGTLGRDTLRGPGQANLDFSVQKRFVLKDGDCCNC